LATEFFPEVFMHSAHFLVLLRARTHEDPSVQTLCDGY